MGQEFPSEYKLNKALRPRVNISGKSEFLLEAKDFKLQEFGIRANEVITTSITSPTPTVAWPFPQLLKGEGITLLCFETAIYSVNETTWVGTLLSTFDATIPANVKAIGAGGGLWQLVSFENQWILTNGASVVFDLPNNTSAGVLIADADTVQAIVIHGRRLIMAGLAGSRLAASDFTKLFDEWQKVVGFDAVTFDTQAVNSSWLMWSTPGGGDIQWPFVEMLLMMDFIEPAFYAKVDEILLEQIKQKRLGFFPLPSNGTVQKMMPLGNNLLIYTTDGVYSGTPTQFGYSISEISRIGIVGRGSVTGDIAQHWYINNGNRLRTIGSEGQSNLQYSEFLSTLTSSEVLMTFDPEERDVYISDSSKGYIWTGTGLTEITGDFPTSLLREDDGTLQGIKAGTTPGQFSLVTGEIDLNFSGLKQITFIDIDYENISCLQLRILYRFDRTRTYAESPWYQGGELGIFYVGASVIDFKIELKGVLEDGAKLERAIIRFQLPESRSVRGPRGTGFGSLQSSDAGDS